MRRLLITLGFPPDLGGMQNYLYARCQAAEAGEIAVLAPDRPGAPDFDGAQPFVVHRWSDALAGLPLLNWVGHFLFPLGKAFKIYQDHDLDVIECGQVLPFALIAWALRRLYGVPYVVWAFGRELLKPQRYPVSRQLLRALLQRAQTVVAVSERTRAEVIGLGVAPEKAVVIHPSVDTARFHPGVDTTRIQEEYDLGGHSVLLTVARLVPRKGVDTVLRAMSLVLHRVPDAMYVVAGDGPHRGELEALAETLGVGGRVRFTGPVPAADLPPLYNLCDVFVMVSREGRGEMEGFGIVYLEAGACGKPVVAGRCGGVVDAVEDGVTGILVGPEDPEAAAEAVVTLLQDPGLAQRMGEAGRERAKRGSDWSRLDGAV